MHIEIVTPTGRVLDEEAQEVTVPGVVGELGILPGHLPIITALAIGELVVRTGQQRRHFAVNKGFLEMAHDRIIVVTETAEEAAQIDVERAQKAKTAAEEGLKALALGTPEYDAGKDKLQRAATRLRVAGRSVH
jgi:F-type H+-transporting ATPase subunit epsilon